MVINGADDIVTEYKKVDMIKYLGIRIKSNLTLKKDRNDDF